MRSVILFVIAAFFESRVAPHFGAHAAERGVALLVAAALASLAVSD